MSIDFEFIFPCTVKIQYKKSKNILYDTWQWVLRITQVINPSFHLGPQDSKTLINKTLMVEHHDKIKINPSNMHEDLEVNIIQKCYPILCNVWISWTDSTKQDNWVKKKLSPMRIKILSEKHQSELYKNYKKTWMILSIMQPTTARQWTDCDWSDKPNVATYIMSSARKKK